MDLDIFDIGARLYDFNKTEIGTCIDSPCAIARAFNVRPVICFVKPYGGELESKRSYLKRVKPKYFSPEAGLHITVGPQLYLKELLEERLGKDFKILLSFYGNNYYFIKARQLDVQDFDEAETLISKIISYAIKKAATSK